MLNKKAFNFTKSIVDNLKISSRKGSEVRSAVPQIGFDGKPLGDEVAEQEFILDSTGKNMLKMRSAYHQITPFCSIVKNELSDETAHQDLPLHTKKIEEFDDIEAIPSEIKNLAVGGRILDYLYSKSENNELIEKAHKAESGKWVKRKFNAPLYKVRYNNKGELLDGKGKHQKKDEQGFYELSFSKHTYTANVSIGIFCGHKVDEIGKEIKDTKGVYLVPTQFGANDSVIPTAQKSGAKFSIFSKLNKVLAHPIYGVVERKDISSNNILVKGKFDIEAIPASIAVYNEDGKVAMVLDDRGCFKISKFRPKKTKTSVAEEIADNTSIKIKENVKSAIKKVTENETKKEASTFVL